MMRLGDIALACGGWIAPESAGRVVTSAVIDSRDAAMDCLFFALAGGSTDGHQYVDNVLQDNGMAVVSRGSKRCGIILVESVEQALLDAAQWRRSNIGSRVIGITGSSGKTTTRLFLTAVLECSYSVYSTSRNLNNHLGMPLTILNAPEEDPDIIILELGMNHAGELLLLGEVASPTDCLVTNIGHAHMEFFNTIDDIARAKAELIRTTAPGGLCVIPVDEDILKSTAQIAELNIRYFGDGGDAWFEEEDGTSIIYPYKKELRLQFDGSHNKMNAVSAVLMAVALNVPIERAITAIAAVSPAKGRGRTVRVSGITILDESYNANPDSTRACLAVLQGIKGSRGAVLGDMRELGKNASIFHREILLKADSIGLDFLILTGELYDSVKAAAVRTRIFMAEDWKEALRILRETASSECTVLVKGSNSLQLGELVRSMEEGI
ncbi:MAG: UDP-N-acetylmuramoyl-tripeptide--D-alanyl-D-alanine ligase [Candidatus Aegiribacteria sp.]|nr:UDP-N-acetylmuramoyl-tripeptide--D-alanyl-D-alanine ligase [Candidatus Aegiribacteria sp.]